MKKALLLLALLAQSLGLWAINYNGQAKSFSQPDGRVATVRLFGSEYYLRAESSEGYTVMRDPATGYICYAQLSGNALVSTGVVYQGLPGEAAALNLPLHADFSEDAKRAIVASNQKRLGGDKSHSGVHPVHAPESAAKITGTPVVPLSGNIKGLCIVVDFSDEPAVVPVANIDSFCNQLNYTGYGNNGSLRTYYRDISGNQLDYQNVVFGYYHAPLSFAEYDAMDYAVGAQIILGEALQWLDDQGFDFSTLTTNADGTIMAINLMYTGNPPNWAQGMWHHQGYYGEFTADGVTTGAYNCSPANAPMELGVVAHENGHMIGKWPDTYKYTDTEGPDGIGSFDLMCAIGDYTNPVPPNPLFLCNAGWMTPVDVTSFNGQKTDTANTLSCFRYNNVNNPNEFFLLKARNYAGRSMSLPDRGLSIWHIDRQGDNQTRRHEVWLEHATNDSTSEDEACFRSDVNPEFGRATAPDARFYNGDFNALRVWDVSLPGITMTYRFGPFATATSMLHLKHEAIFNDTDGDGFLEGGETANVPERLSNAGPAASGLVAASCIAVGPNAGLVTVNTPTIAPGALAAAGNTLLPFSITLSPAADMGDTITLRYTAIDGADTVFVFRNIVVGDLIPMTEESAVACAGIFVDPGGLYDDYAENLDIIKTISAPAGALSVTAEFTEFSVEAEADCNYDYLEIYDGPGIASPLLGKWCGSNSPGTVTSTNADAALTFRFHSDWSTNSSGWLAQVSCEQSSSGVGMVGGKGGVQLFPNPTTGVVNGRTAGEASVTVSSAVGAVIQRMETSSGAFTVDLSGMPAGVYLFRIQAADGAVNVRKITLSGGER